MSELGFVGMFICPYALFWRVFLIMDWKPEPKVIGNALKIVKWINNYVTTLACGISLVLVVISSLMTVAAFFQFDEWQSKGWIASYYSSFLSIVVIQCIVLIAYRLLHIIGKREGLMQ